MNVATFRMLLKDWKEHDTKRAGDNAFQAERVASPRALRLKRDMF